MQLAEKIDVSRTHMSRIENNDCAVSLDVIFSIAKALDIPEADVTEALDAVCAPVSLYDPVYTDGGDPLTVMDQVRDTRNTEGNWMERLTLMALLSRR